MERLHNFAIGFPKIEAPSLRKIDLMLSIPAAFVMSKFFKILTTSSSDTLLRQNVLSGILPL